MDHIHPISPFLYGMVQIVKMEVNRSKQKDHLSSIRRHHHVLAEAGVMYCTDMHSRVFLGSGETAVKGHKKMVCD